MPRSFSLPGPATAIVLALLSLVLAGCVAIGPKETRLPTAKGVFLARLDPYATSRPRLIGYSVVSAWTQLSEADATRVANAINRQIEATPKPGKDTIKLLPFCIPRRGLGVRIITDRGSRDVAVCLGCEVIIVTDATHRGEEMVAGPEVLKELKALFAQLYPGQKGT